MNSNSAVQSILDTYDTEDLTNIAEHGCVSGCASSHIYYTETSAFYDKYEEEVNDYLREIFGDNFLFDVCSDCHDMVDMKNKLTWSFIELVAQDEMYAEVA